MKKINKQFRRLRKEWKILIAVVFTCFLFGGYMLYVQADTNVSLSLYSSSVTLSGTDARTTELYVNSLTGHDDNEPESESENNVKAENVRWTTSNPDIIQFYADNVEGNITDSVPGLTPTLIGRNAGISTVTATYYSKTYNAGILQTETAVKSASARATVRLTHTFTDNYSHSTPDGFIYQVGDTITVTTNAGAMDNPPVVELSNQGVVENTSTGGSAVSLKVVGGGQATVTIRTADGDGVDALTYRFTIKSAVEFKTGVANAQGHSIYLDSTTRNKTMVLQKQDNTDGDFVEFSNEIIPSNVVNPATAEVTYRSADPDVATVTAGTVCGVHAGVTTIRAGFLSLDTIGTEMWTGDDSVIVIVPFKKLGSKVQNINVGDQLQLSTSANPTQVTFSTSNNSVLQVDSTTGLVTAMGAGTATITATLDQENPLILTYGMNSQLQWTITVIDGFGLSTTNTSVNIGDSFELNAIVTNDVATYPVIYNVENQPNAAGVVPTGDLITVVQDGAKMTVTGVKSGTALITVTQTYNGVTKKATCVVYVTTPVDEVSINPSSIQVDRGSTDTVQLLFNPAGPTNANVLWSSSNPAVATVEGDSYTATITGVAGGTATITVITEDGLKVATCDVYVREPVTGISLNQTTVESSMAIGQYQMVATILPLGEGVNRNVIWSSSDTSVATIDENGLVKYVKPGYCTIVAKTEDGAYIATCNFFISIPVETITLDYTDEIMSIGGSLRITAEVLPVTASNKTVTWESSNTAVAMVDSNGLVRAVGTGSCTILCKSLDGGVTAMCNIYVKQPVTSVVLNTTDITVRKGQTFWLNATCLPENADNKICTWESRDEEVCTVDNTGKVIATGAGTTSIICTNTDTGLTAYCVVTVTQPITGITLNSDYQMLWVGAKYAIIPNIEPFDAENKNVTYMSSDSSVATVDEYGIVTAVKGGSCVIEVTTEESHLIAACTIDVKEYVSSIELSETNKFMNVGASGTLTAAVGTSTATNKNLQWSSSNYDICSVDQNGNVIANSVGTAVITATAADGSGVSASCIIRVVNPVTSISIVPDTVRILVGGSAKVEAVIYPDNATIKNVTWASSNESVATVDESGEIFALATGKVKITATSMDGNNIQGVCWVYVTPVVNISSLRINSSEIYMLTGKSRQLSVRVRPVTNTDSYEWFSTDTGVVVVNQDGVITTVGPGTAEVIVESDNNGVSSTCIVHSLGLSSYYLSLDQYDYYDLDVIGTTDKITWRSSNPRVCTIDSSGHIVARMAGTTTVSAIVDNKTLTCTVRVYSIR